MGWSRRSILTVSILSVVHGGLALGIARHHFAALDETGHVPSGVAHWRTGDLSAYNVNPPLARMIAALPVLVARPKLNLDLIDDTPGVRPEWALARDFAAANAARYVDLIRLARLPGIVWSIAGLWLVALWARDLYGELAGCLSAAFWCFDPTILTFASFVVPDVPAAVAGFGATYLFWRFLRAPSTNLAWYSGLALGIGLLTKFTLLALDAIWPLLWLIRRPENPVGRKSAFKHAAIVVLSSLFIVNLGYGFAGSFRPLGDFSFVSRTFAGAPVEEVSSSRIGPNDNRFRATALGSLPVPVPADYLNGIDVQRRDFEIGVPSYLNGVWRNQGWYYYYIYAIFIKEPLGFLALAVWSFALIAMRRRACARPADEWFLLMPALVFLALVSSQTGFSHHMRYALPAWPFVIAGMGKLAYFLDRRRKVFGGIVVALWASSIASVLIVYPHLMSYFNEIAGGPKRGSEHLLDSNMDWGQDLLDLKRWLDAHPEARPLGLAYFNVIDPRVVGIDYVLPPPGPNGLFVADRAYQAHFGPHPGFYAVSVAYLRGATFSAPDGRGGFRRIDRDDYAYFRRFRPIARAGYSILIYRISPRQANALRARLGLPKTVTRPGPSGCLNRR